MDIHMRGISYSTSRHQVVLLFSTCSTTLIILTINFSVFLFKDRYGRGQAHSGSGSLTLLAPVALRFLQEYGEPLNGTLPPKSFHVGGRRVRFSAGRSKPRTDVVDRLIRFPYADPVVAQQRENDAQVLDSESVLIRTLQFGWSCRDSVFSAEWEHHAVSTLKVVGERREIRISIPYIGGIASAGMLYIAIRLGRIDSVHVYSEFSQKVPVIFFHLSEPPVFELSLAGTELRQRLSHLPLSGHDRVAPFTSLALRLVCGNTNDLGIFRRLAKTARISLHDTEVQSEGRGLFSADILEQVEARISALRWNVAFQVEKIFRNLCVDGQELLTIIPRIRDMIDLHGRTYTTTFLRHFGPLVQFWYPDYDSIRLQSIEEYFDQVHDDFEKLVKAPSLDPTDNSVFQSLHVTITPTTIYLDGPFRSNRVIRRYLKHQDCFLRVCFVDEGNLQYRWDRELDCVAFTRRRVGEFLIDKGLTIAGRLFKFLAYSQSALKEHAVWFVRPFKGPDGLTVTEETIIAGLGNFEPLRNCPARYAARISQAFTATDSTSVEVEEIIRIPDISTPNEKYVFTDGVGTMSLELARSIWAELKASRRRNRRAKHAPRALQIRFQGCKGVLSVDHRLKGNVICIRPSMEKFQDPNSLTIDIARAFHKPGPYFLNRPLIMLMEWLGIPYPVFKASLQKYQDKAVRDTRDSTRSLATFARMLETHGLGTAYRLPSVLLGLSQLGVEHIPDNKFYSKLLEFAVHHVLRTLKTKARIPIPGGVTLVGVADEHKYLREGEIFVCTRDPNTNRVEYIEGDVLISRSPTIHPGDVRLARAIGRPPPGSPYAKEPLPNTVVFSVLGTRPLPSCLGGGDLDGDEYNIIPLNKCPEFRIQRANEPPGEYAPSVRKLVDHKCTMVDVASFVIEYINSDALGIVATNWLIIADKSEKGIWDEDCLKLAALHSDASDYPKTGQPVAMNTIPKPKEKSKPDWHAPEVNANMSDFYPSQRAIGKLFRVIDLPEIHAGSLSKPQRRRIRQGRGAPDVDELTNSLDHFNMSDDNPILVAIEDRISVYTDTEEKPPETMEYIARIFSRYVSEMQAICVSHSLSHSKNALLSEEEATVGTIVAKTSQPRKRQELISGLREKSDMLVRSVKEELTGDDDQSWETVLQHGWLSLELALGSPDDAFGAQSFMWIALGVIFDALKEIEAEESTSRR
ncbi:RNA-directed RNA polymerase 2 [Roridomyces roridus]|uniref:RNA-dependent RNA polymerase n=1 Tax=Roridomyces roridus TaxID=1738132 RepID=A0AAD7BU28_9AGAR|nr:RNA-directed RNA polymerase 2 [Roridomyces roridus]